MSQSRHIFRQFLRTTGYIGGLFGERFTKLQLVSNILKKMTMNRKPALGFLKRSLSLVSDTANKVSSELHNSRSRLYTSFGKSPDQDGQRRRNSNKRNESVLKNSFLMIQTSSIVNRSWKLRRVTLLEDQLCYPKEIVNDDSRTEWKSIRISEIISVKIPNDSYLLQSKNTNTFYVKTSQSKILFRCKSQEARDEWMTAILMAKSSLMVKDNSRGKRA